jgi:hypothetical protein
MYRLMQGVAAGALIIGLAGCYNKDEANYSDNGYNATAAAENGAYDANASGTQYAGAGSWPEGSRIVVEDNVTYRIDPGGVRVRLGDADSRIEVIDGVRYRIDPGGTRIRIDDQGMAIRVPVDANASVEVNTH